MSYVPEFVVLYEIVPYIRNLPLNNETIRIAVKDYLEGGKKKDDIKPYDIGDNEFYWFNLAGTKIFYVIPEDYLKKEENIRENISLHKKDMPQKDNYDDQWTYKFRFSYDTINQPEERARLLKMFEDKELEMRLSLEMNNLEIGVEESKDENLKKLI